MGVSGGEKKLDRKVGIVNTEGRGIAISNSVVRASIIVRVSKI